MANIFQLADRDIIEPLSAGIEVFVNLDGRFLHHSVCILATSTEKEVLSPGNPSVPIVVIESDSQKGSRFPLRFTPVGCFHYRTSLTQDRKSATKTVLMSDRHS